MRVTDITSVRAPIPEDGTRFERFCESWVVRKVLHPLLELPIRLYFHLKLNWACPIIAIAIMLLISLFVLSEHWWMKQIFISKTIVKMARAAELTESQIDSMTPKEYIVYKFGKDSDIALKVANGEGLNHPCNDWNPNNNKSIDVGVFRINSIHFKRPGVNITTMSDCHKNIDFAHILFKEQGWCPWVAYQKLYPYACK